MRVLLISDEPSAFLWDYFKPENVAGIELVLSAGDLKHSYLEFIATMVPCPMVYVPGNHDRDFNENPPPGGLCADGTVVTVQGLRIAGLGGCMGSNPVESFQYTEKQMSRRVAALDRMTRRGGVDVFLTHAPAAGLGDGQDAFHQGFACFLPYIDKHKPRLHVYGHQHKSYNAHGEMEFRRNGVWHVNACGYRIVEI